MIGEAGILSHVRHHLISERKVFLMAEAKLCGDRLISLPEGMAISVIRIENGVLICQDLSDCLGEVLVPPNCCRFLTALELSAIVDRPRSILN